MATFEITAPDGRTFEVTAPEGATKEQVLSYAQSQLGPKPPQKIETMAESITAESQKMNPLSRLAIGVHGAVNDAAMRLKQLLGRDLTPEVVRGIEAHRALSADSGMATAGNVIGNLAMTATPGIAAERAAASVIGAALPKVVAPTVAAAGTGAAINAATTPVLEGESALDAAKWGAVGGAAGNTLARGLSRVARPVAPNADVQTLLDKGVVPTPGRAAGANTLAGRLEQSLESLPLVGQIIKNGNLRAIEELNRAAVNSALPNGARVQVVGRRAIEEARDIFDNAYRQALTGKKVPVNASSLQQATQTIKNDPDVFLSDAAEKDLAKLTDQLVRRIPSSGELTGEAAKKLDSWLGGIAARYNRSTDTAQREFGSAVLGLQKEFRTTLSQSVPGLKEIDGKYSEFLRIQRAAGMTGSKAGAFSPEALQSSVRAMDSSRSGFARGNAVMQDLSDPAVAVLGRTVPDSGTAGRALTALGLTGAGVDSIFGSPGYLTALELSPLLYSRAGGRYVLGDLPGQAAASDALGRLAPFASQVGRASTGR